MFLEGWKITENVERKAAKFNTYTKQNPWSWLDSVNQKF